MGEVCPVVPSSPKQDAYTFQMDETALVFKFESCVSTCI